MASTTADSSAAAAPSTALSPPASPWSNRNVRGALAFSVCYALGSCLWAGDAQVAYLFLRTGRDNVAVGYFEGCSGIAQTAAAVPVALLIDRYRRDTSLRAAGVIGAAAVALTAWAVAFNSGAGASLAHLWAPLVLWGVFDAVSGAAVGA
jgi:hypothetical protein